jgi:hypothetical protein
VCHSSPLGGSPPDAAELLVLGWRPGARTAPLQPEQVSSPADRSGRPAEPPRHLGEWQPRRVGGAAQVVGSVRLGTAASVGGDAERPPAGIDGVGRPAQRRGDPLAWDACAVPPPEGGVLLPGPAAGHYWTTLSALGPALGCPEAVGW